MPCSTVGTSRPSDLPCLRVALATRAIALVKILIAELAGNAERHRQVEMPDPQAVDAVDRRHRVGVLHALRRLDLAEQGRAPVGGSELVGDGAGPVAVVRDLQRHAALADRVVFHRVDDVPHLLDDCRPSAASGLRRPCPWRGRCGGIRATARARSPAGRPPRNSAARSSPSRSRSPNARDRRARSRSPPISGCGRCRASRTRR